MTTSGEARSILKERSKYTKVFVATPAYDGKVDVDYAASLANAMSLAGSWGIQCVVSCMANGAFIEIARSVFAKKFLETDCTHLFFIDGDLKFDPHSFMGLVMSGLPICAGVYRRRQSEETYPVQYIESEQGGVDLVDGGYVMCNRVPTGFLCISREVIEEMSKDAKIWSFEAEGKVPKLFYTYDIEREDNHVQFVGEDFAFCDDYVKKYGKGIHVWPDFTFKHGGYEGNWLKFMHRVSKEQQEEDSLLRVGNDA